MIAAANLIRRGEPKAGIPREGLEKVKVIRSQLSHEMASDFPAMACWMRSGLFATWTSQPKATTRAFAISCRTLIQEQSITGEFIYDSHPTYTAGQGRTLE